MLTIGSFQVFGNKIDSGLYLHRHLCVLYMEAQKLVKQVVAGGFYFMWMANALERMGGLCV